MKPAKEITAQDERDLNNANAKFLQVGCVNTQKKKKIQINTK
jgi:hypothetical protein